MGLQVWLPLNGDYKNLGADGITFAQNTGATVDSEGKTGQCYSFDATDDWIQYNIDKSKYGGKPTTYTFWFKCDQSKAKGTILDLAADLCAAYSYSSSGIKFSYWRCYTNGSGNRTGAGGTTPNYYDATKWHHVAIVFNANINQIYVDGELALSEDKSNLYTTYWTPLLGSSYNKFSFGKSAGDSSWIGGKLSDIRIYDERLSPLQIKQISKGLVLHYKLDKCYGDKIQDCSGYNNNGTIVGTFSTTTGSPRYNTTPVFASGPYIKKTGFTFTSNTWTICAWFYKTSVSTNAYDTICGLTTGNGADANKKFSIYAYNNQVGFVGEKTSHSNITTIDQSLWHHVCVTNAEGTHKFYLDGVLKGTYTNTNNMTSCTDFVVGARAAAANATSFSTPWNGYISDVRLYCTALPAEDVLGLYHTGAKIDKNGNFYAYNFIEGSAEKIYKTGNAESHNLTEGSDSAKITASGFTANRFIEL